MRVLVLVSEKIEVSLVGDTFFCVYCSIGAVA